MPGKHLRPTMAFTVEADCTEADADASVSLYWFDALSGEVGAKLHTVELAEGCAAGKYKQSTKPLVVGGGAEWVVARVENVCGAALKAVPLSVTYQSDGQLFGDGGGGD